MKGVSVAKAGAPFEVVDGLEKPVPGEKQILVQSMVTGINPVDGMMQGYGLLVTSWPIVLGCDASGIVVDVGAKVAKFKKGDAVFGCTRLGVVGHSTFQEYFLMDEDLTFPKPRNITLEQGATLGVGTLTASLGVIGGLGVQFPGLEGASPKDEWIVVLGGAGSVGQYAVQISKICGYKVLASCSPANDELLKSLGADATVNYRIPIEEQLTVIKSTTGGNFSKVIDTSAQSTETAFQALAKVSSSPKKFFSTVDDWSEIAPVADTTIHRIMLGPIGRTGEDAKKTPDLNANITSYIVKLVEYLEKGALKPQKYEVFSEQGLEGVPKAVALVNSGKMGSTKCVVKLQ